jgi:hypothetical protein
MMGIIILDRESAAGAQSEPRWGLVGQSRQICPKYAIELRKSNSQVPFSMRGSMSYLDRARKRTRVT